MAPCARLSLLSLCSSSASPWFRPLAPLAPKSSAFSLRSSPRLGQATGQGGLAAPAFVGPVSPVFAACGYSGQNALLAVRLSAFALVVALACLALQGSNAWRSQKTCAMQAQTLALVLSLAQKTEDKDALKASFVQSRLLLLSGMISF
jgi:hypothetical protein